MLHVPVFPKGQYFGWEKKLWEQRSLGSGRGWQGYFSLGVLEGMSSEAKTCHSFKIMQLLYLMLF